MTVTASRVQLEHGYTDGQGTLSQQFRFDATSAAELIAVILGAPLTGDDSLFGSRPGRAGERTTNSWRLHDFSPAPGFVFDLALAEDGGVMVVHFSQPRRSSAFLRGDALWTVSEQDSQVIFDEQINTHAALDVVNGRLGGTRRSLRRRLFFMLGHRKVMDGFVENVMRLLNA